MKRIKSNHNFPILFSVIILFYLRDHFFPLVKFLSIIVLFTLFPAQRGLMLFFVPDYFCPGSVRIFMLFLSPGSFILPNPLLPSLISYVNESTFFTSIHLLLNSSIYLLLLLFPASLNLYLPINLVSSFTFLSRSSGQESFDICSIAGAHFFGFRVFM